MQISTLKSASRMIAPERKNTVLTRSEPVRCYMIIRFLSRIQI